MKFRKKPVVIEAECFLGPDFPLPFSGRGDPCCYGAHPNDAHGTGNPVWQIHTLEGAHIVSVGDWVIRGVKGEFYPCKPDIFVATYDAVEAHP